MFCDRETERLQSVVYLHIEERVLTPVRPTVIIVKDVTGVEMFTSDVMEVWAGRDVGVNIDIILWNHLEQWGVSKGKVANKDNSPL